MKISAFIIFILFSSQLFGQSQLMDTVKIKPAQIFYQSGAGGTIQKINSDSSSSNSETIGELLSKSAGVYINQNGVSGVQTISIRGAGSSHTNVYWNGLALNSPTIGRLDFSTIAANSNNDIEIHYGSSGLIDGSGGLGGNIQIADRLTYDSLQQILLNIGYGSYQKNHQNFNIKLANQKWSAIVNFNKINAKNNFEFIDPTETNNPTDTLENAKTDLWSFKFGIGRQWNKSKIESKIWHTSSKRQLPNNITASNFGVAKQSDESLRAIINYSYTTNTTIHKLNLGVVDDTQVYTNNEESVFKTKSYQGNYQFTWYGYKGLKVKSALEVQKNTANSDGFSEPKSEEKFAIMLNPQWKFKNKLTADLILRMETYDRILTPLMPTFLLNFKVNNYINIKGSAAKIYKNPSLNDLYWALGGNPNLRPERGNTMELGVSVSNNKSFNINITAFTRQINNWIIWLPNTESTWSPYNLFSVKSHGIDWWMNGQKQISKSMLVKGKLNFSYTESKNTKSLNNNDNTINKQIIYLPKSKVMATLSLRVKNKLQLNYTYRFTDKRYIARDHSQWMPYYMISDFSASYSFKSISFLEKMTLAINNVLNKDYQVIPFQPMMKRNIMFTVSFNFQK